MSILIDGIEIKIDLEKYLTSKGLAVRYVGNNLMACCPFHQDRRPSFGVSLDTGAYNCFGCGAKGSFVNLVKRLEHFETEFDAVEYLIRQYGVFSKTTDPLDLDFDETVYTQDYYIADGELLSNNFNFRHPYLERRGISERVQRIFGIGYSKEHRAITIPWRDHHGRLITFKMRQTFRKKFWFYPPMPPNVKRRTLWSLDKVLKWGLNKVAITEGEIDALSVWQVEQVGVVALGGNVLTDEQASRLKQSLPPDGEIIIFTDNDRGGEQAKKTIIDQLSGHFLITAVDWSLVPGTPKDANDLSCDQIKKLLDKRQEIGLNLTF